MTSAGGSWHYPEYQRDYAWGYGGANFPYHPYREPMYERHPYDHWGPPTAVASPVTLPPPRAWCENTYEAPLSAAAERDRPQLPPVRLPSTTALIGDFMDRPAPLIMEPSVPASTPPSHSLSARTGSLKRRRDESWDGGPVDEVAAPGARPSTSSPAVDNVGTLKVEGHPMRQVASPLTVPTSAPIKTALTELPKRLKKAPATEAAPLKRGKYHGRTRASKAEMEERSPEQAEPITLPSSISTVESSAASRQQRRTETVCCVTCDAELCQLIFHNSGKVDRDGSTPLCLRCNGSSDGARQCALCQADVFYIGDDDSMNFEEVEIVCGKCTQTYAFCTECGGGGKFRTGKWRPKELFAGNRRTCSLSHIRIGQAPLEFVVWTQQELEAKGIKNELLNECFDVLNDCIHATAALPKVLETGTPAGTYAELQEVIDRHFKEFAAFFHQPQHKGTRVDRYLAVCYMKETRRKKGKAFPAATSQHPLIATTAAAAVNPTSSGSSTSTIVTTTSLSSAGSGSGLFDALPTATSHSQSDATAPTRQTMVACATLEWDLDRPHRVLAHHLILRIPTLQQGAIDGELICAMIERIEADWRRMRGGAAGRESVEEGAIDDEDERRPTRLLLAVPKVYQRWKAQATRLGFVGTAASGDVAGIEDLEWMGASFEDIKRNSAGKSKGKSKSKGKR